jgi:hypothetical protein
VWHFLSGGEESAGTKPETADTKDSRPEPQPKPGEKPVSAPDKPKAKPEPKKAIGSEDSEDATEEDDDAFGLGPIDPESPAAGYLEAFNLLKLSEDRKKLLRPSELIAKVLKEGWNEEYPELVKLLEDNREALRKLKEVIDAGGGHFPIPEDADISVKINHIRPARAMAELLALEARWFQKEGDIENAARNIADGISFTQDFTRGATLIADMVGTVMQGYFLDITTQEFDKTAPNARFCSAIERSLYDLEYSRADAADSLRTEEMLMRNYLTPYIDMDQTLRQRALGASELSEEDISSEALRSTIDLHGRWTAELSSVLERGYYPAIRKAEEICGKIASKDPDIPKLVNLVSPLYVDVVKAKAQSKARFEMARTGIALQNYAKAKGGYPESLELLVPRYIPRVPVDPFSGKPIKYTRGEEGWTLRSFGPDMDDDKGAKKIDKDNDDGDIILQKK